MDLDLHPKILLKERANIPDTTALLDYKYVQTTLETMYYSITFMIQMKKGATASQCLQITEKVSFYKTVPCGQRVLPDWSYLIFN